MTEHAYKFGDRAHKKSDGWLVIVTEDDGENVHAIFDDNSSGWHSKALFTPGWPAPEGYVRVRAAATALTDKRWAVSGHIDDGDDYATTSAIEMLDVGTEHGTVTFIEADIPLPAKPETVQGEVVG